MTIFTMFDNLLRSASLCLLALGLGEGGAQITNDLSSVSDTLGQACNRTHWKITSKPFLDFYGSRDVQTALTDRLQDPEQNFALWLDRFTIVKQNVLTVHAEAWVAFYNLFTTYNGTLPVNFYENHGACFTSLQSLLWPALILNTHDICACDPRNYGQLNGSSQGRVHAKCDQNKTELNCYIGVECVGGYCGGEQKPTDISYNVKMSNSCFTEFARTHLLQPCNYSLWSTLMEPLVEAQNGPKCSARFDTLTCSKLLAEAQEKLTEFYVAHNYTDGNPELLSSLCGLRTDMWCSVSTSQCMCSKYFVNEENGICVAQKHALCSITLPCSKDAICLPEMKETLVFNFTQGLNWNGTKLSFE